MAGKYFGILKNFDFEDNSVENINNLIATNIFEKIYYEFNSENESENENIKDWFFGDTNNIILFKELYIFNNEICLDVLNYILQNFIFNELDWFTNEIEIKVNQKLLKTDKIEIYKNSYQDQYNKIKNKTIYALFKDKKETDGIESFEEYFIYQYTKDNEDYTNVKNYLIGAKNYINDDLLNLLWDYYLTSYIYDYCNEQIKILQSENKQKTIENLSNNIQTKKENKNLKSYSIFIEDGESIFYFINSKYAGIKNNAYFSYLYNYLQVKEKLIDNFKKDNKDYREFIIETTQINKFSRIINSNSFNLNTKENIFKTFNNIMKSYSDYTE
jgi:hypothetical protein